MCFPYIQGNIFFFSKNRLLGIMKKTGEYSMEKDNTLIQKKSFVSAVIILFSLLILTGILTYFITPGSFQYETVDGVTKIVPNTFQYTNEPSLPFYRIFTAPLEVLFVDGNILVISIILFLLIIGGSIFLLNDIGIIEFTIQKIIKKYAKRKYLLLSLLSLFFMSIGAFIGVFEEIVPLVPIMIILSKRLGFDTKTGLAISILSAGFGFSAAVTNPFTIGVAQQLIDLPLFSGFGYRLIIFVISYFIVLSFILLHAKKVYQKRDEAVAISVSIQPQKASIIWVALWGCMLIISILLSPFFSFLQDYNMVLIAIYFLIASIGASILNRTNNTFTKFFKGVLQMTPGIVLILLATGVKQVITASSVMDTILYHLANYVEGKSNPFVVLGSYFFTLFSDFFIGSGSAKAFLMMPILAPLYDLSGISRQLAVLAFQLGDGFSNIFYPTNAVLLVALGLANFSYIKWFKWTVLLQIVMVIMSIIFLLIGLSIGY
jgi:uncharacterized ion transporter superfamily protein YfcC